MPLAPGVRLGPYRIESLVGAGGMGEVWCASDERLDRCVAIKSLPAAFAADPGRLKSFTREERATGSLSHPNIVTVHDVGVHEGTPYLVEELLEGEPLKDRLVRGGLPVAEALRVGAGIASALVAAHGKGIVHRDLKPANVFLTKDGTAKVLDFGLATCLAEGAASHDTTQSETSLPGAGRAVGTLAYMAPEQLLGRPVDGRSDVWALGVVLYEMLTGVHPFEERLSTARVEQILHRDPPPPGKLRSDLPPLAEQVVLKCLEKDPARRYQAARELLVDLDRLGSAVALRPGPTLRRRLGRRALGASIGLLAIAAVAVTGYRAIRAPDPSAGAPAGRVMLAVLPVENLSGDPEQEYFSDGLTEEMIARLSRISPRRLGVIARTSAMRYKGKRSPVDEIGRTLGVDYVVESSVRREASRVRVTAQLVQVRDQTHLWAESYERDVAGVLALQREISEQIARALALELLPGEPASARLPDPRAYELYRKGRHDWHRRNILKATEQFKAATVVDPGYALAWAGLADTYALYPFYGVLPEREAFPLARAAAHRALELESSLYEARTTLAFLSFYFDWDWAATEAQLATLLEERPDDPVARQWHSEYLAAMGRFEAALAELKRGQRSDPLSPMLRAMEGYVHDFNHQFRNAIEACRLTAAVDPDFSTTPYLLAMAHEGLGEYETALDYWRRLERGQDATTRGLDTARLLARLGRRAEARERLRRVVEASRSGPALAPAIVATVHVALGEHAEAMDCLEQAYEQRSFRLLRVRHDFRYDPLHSDPRFVQLVRRMNFPPR